VHMIVQKLMGLGVFAVQFGSVLREKVNRSKIKIMCIRSKYMRFNLDRFLDIQSATCIFFININITHTH
jgi:hypothetical protein